MTKIAAENREAGQELSALCNYIEGAISTPLPVEVSEKAKHHVLDTFAAIISGVDLSVGKVALGYQDTQGGAPEASVAGRSNLTTASMAAMTNAMLAHWNRKSGSQIENIGWKAGCTDLRWQSKMEPFPAALLRMADCALTGLRLMSPLRPIASSSISIAACRRCGSRISLWTWTMILGSPMPSPICAPGHRAKTGSDC